MNFELIIFDLDGTLTDTLADITDITNKVLSVLGYPLHSQTEYKYFVGNGLKNLVIKSLPESARTEDIIEKGYEKVLIEYTNTPVNKTKLYDGISELLYLLESKKIKKAILSNKADPITKKICEKLLSEWCFEIIIGANGKFPRKPDPTSALYIANTLGINPENILYVGDSGVDMETALRAGFTSVGVTWGFRKKEELIENGAKHIISHPVELIEILEIEDENKN